MVEVDVLELWIASTVQTKYIFIVLGMRDLKK